MNAFRVDPGRSRRTAIPLVLAAFLTFAGVLSLAGPQGSNAWGQNLPPSPATLVPRDILGSTPLAEPEMAPQTGVAPALSSFAAPGLGGRKSAIGGIEVNPLAQIAPDAIGVLGAEDGGFGIEMWRGTPRNVIEGLLERMPSRLTSRGMRDLARRLLISVAPPPAVKPRVFASTAPNALGLSAPDGADRAGLLITRLRLLADLGEVPALISLLSVVPGHLERESLEHLHIEALFLNHEREEACRRIRNSISLYHEQAFWQKALVFCNMAAGDLDRGLLGLDLLREQGVAGDPLFFALANRLGGVEGVLPEIETLSPLHVAMLTTLDAPLPDGAIEGAPPGVLYAIATATKVAPLTRAAAAEQACALGLIDGAALGRGYDAVSFTPEQLGNAINAAADLEGTAALALLYQATRRESLPAARAEVLRDGLEALTRANLSSVAVEVYGPLIAEIDPTPQMAWFAEAAGRALYGTRRLVRANDWLALARQESIINPLASAAVAALWPYSRLAGGETLASNGDLEAWRVMREAAGVEPPSGAISLLRSSFQALGESDSLHWSDIAALVDPTGRSMPDAAFLYALEDASEAKRVGETVLLSLIVLGEDGPAGAHVMALGTVIASLRRIGLEPEARALAIEAAMGSGV